ncbi:uncharacterized protein LOC126604091 isoform X2 [Malus sylvestris]|nr:uncharacterized protein LOC126604091 isoform X2 [Malus sylvestris]
MEYSVRVDRIYLKDSGETYPKDVRGQARLRGYDPVTYLVNDGWKPILTLGNGVEISKRTSGSFHTFRSRFLLTSLSPYQFIIIPNTIDAAKQWDPHLVEARYIKDLGDNISIICLMFRDHSKPPFRNREFVVYERCENMEDGTLVVAVVSLPKEIAAGLEPQQNDAIRGLLLQSGWVVEKLQVGSCRMNAEVFCQST